METLLSIAIGLGLSAACGFRVFVPFFFASVAAFSGHLELTPAFEWIGTLPALLAFGTATVLEVAAYYLPWFDHLLDTVTTPAAIVAGVLASAAIASDLSPLLRWGIAMIGGGTVASIVQGATVVLRLKSTAVTGGAANPLFATAELFGASVTAVLALLVPILCVVLVIGLCIVVFRSARGLMFSRPHGP